MYDVELNGVVIKMRSIKGRFLHKKKGRFILEQLENSCTKWIIYFSQKERLTYLVKNTEKIDLDLLIINFRIASKYKIRFSIICAVTQTEFLVGRVLWILVRWDKTLRVKNADSRLCMSICTRETRSTSQNLCIACWKIVLSQTCKCIWKKLI